MSNDPTGVPEERPPAGGRPDASGPEDRQSATSGVERAREALAQAKADARQRGEIPGATSRGGRPRRRRPAREGGDPLPLRAAIDDFLSARGWEQHAATASVFGRWPQIVGPDVAEHTQPDRLEEGTLTVVADSTAWATQVRLLAANLVRRLNEDLGDDTVRRVKVHGPSAQGWRTGRLRAPGSRGPRDTYG